MTTPPPKNVISQVKHHIGSYVWAEYILGSLFLSRRELNNKETHLYRRRTGGGGFQDATSGPVFVERPPSHDSLLPRKTKKTSSLWKRKVQLRAPAAPSSGRSARAQEHPHELSPNAEVADGPSVQKRVRPPFSRKDKAPQRNAPYRSGLTAQRALAMLQI